jgi:glycosyltransferase involved in cell wall biosynthesis
MNNKHQFYAWITYQRRNASMQSYFNYELKFIHSFIKQKWLKPFDYVLKGIWTAYLLLKNKPQILWVQLPPSPLMDIASLYHKITNKVVLIADCHNNVFWGIWKKYLNIEKLNECDVIIVHNHVIYDIAVNLGININKLIILEDKPAVYDMNKPVPPKMSDQYQVLMPCSFGIDEPLEVVFDAARKIPDVNILISGDSKRGKHLFNYSKKPENVKFTGYLSCEDYETTFRQSDLILGLTTEDHIQLSVANEATGFEIPMALSNTKLLRELFNKGAIYVETLNADSIAAGIIEALAKKEILKKEIQLLKIERNQKWENMAIHLKEKINIILK